MTKINWKAVSKNTKKVRRNIKNIALVADYFKDIPGEGKFKDNISKNIVEIKECKSSSLRRYLKVIKNYYYLAETEKDRNILLKKQDELEKELLLRGELEEDK